MWNQMLEKTLKVCCRWFKIWHRCLGHDALDLSETTSSKICAFSLPCSPCCWNWGHQLLQSPKSLSFPSLLSQCSAGQASSHVHCSKTNACTKLESQEKSAEHSLLCVLFILPEQSLRDGPFQKSLAEFMRFISSAWKHLQAVVAASANQGGHNYPKRCQWIEEAHLSARITTPHSELPSRKNTHQASCRTNFKNVFPTVSPAVSVSKGLWWLEFFCRLDKRMSKIKSGQKQFIKSSDSQPLSAAPCLFCVHLLVLWIPPMDRAEHGQICKAQKLSERQIRKCSS